METDKKKPALGERLKQEIASLTTRVSELEDKNESLQRQLEEAEEKMKDLTERLQEEMEERLKKMEAEFFKKMEERFEAEFSKVKKTPPVKAKSTRQGEEKKNGACQYVFTKGSKRMGQQCGRECLAPKDGGEPERYCIQHVEFVATARREGYAQARVVERDEDWANSRCKHVISESSKRGGQRCGRRGMEKYNGFCTNHKMDAMKKTATGEKKLSEDTVQSEDEEDEEEETPVQKKRREEEEEEEDE